MRRMAENRMFVSQETLDTWLGNDEVDVEGEIMILKRLRQSFQLETAYHFLTEIAEGGDEQELVGKVKTMAQLAELDGEYCAGSVILGDNAYEVIEGFLGLPMQQGMGSDAGDADKDPSDISGHDLAAATRAAAGDGDANPPSQELDLLAQFFLGAKH